MALSRIRGALQLASKFRTGLESALLVGKRQSSGVTEKSEIKEESIEEIRVRIFGEEVKGENQSLKTLLQRSWNIEEIVNYYPEPISDPLLRDLDREKKRVKIERLRRRGKGKPPKGQGKRASGKSRRR